MGERAPARRRAIAIDGPAASGKSTTARRVAERLGFVHLNSGLLYRAITWRALQAGLDAAGDELDRAARRMDIGLRREHGELRVTVDGRDPGADLRGAEVSSRVSAVAARSAVREAVLARLRAAGEAFDLVCDGRDIGTTVFPHADLKIFLVADPRERARRRLLDLDLPVTEARLAIEADRLRARDAADAGRSLSPLRRAEDALEIDTTHRAPEEVVERIVALAAERGLGRPPGDDPAPPSRGA